MFGTVHRLSNIYNISYLNLFQPLGRTRGRCEDNIKMVLKIVWGGGLDWMALAQDREEWAGHGERGSTVRIP